MPSPDPTEILTAINRIWQEADPKEIASLVEPYFTDDIVVVAPNLVRVAKGRAAAAASYADFVRSITILQVQIEQPQVDFCGNVAIATMRWKMQYEFGGRSNAESGHDAYVFRLDGGCWRICWRCVASAQEQ